MDKQTTNITEKKQSTTQAGEKTPVVGDSTRLSIFHPRFIASIADEVAKLVIQRLPKRSLGAKKKQVTKNKYTVGAYFLDTSAIIDGRIFDVIQLGLLSGVICVPSGVLLELKHIADSKDPLKKDRGRKGLELLEKVKKSKNIKLMVMPEDKVITQKHPEVDEQLIATAKANKGKIITCDYNLEKKANISGITAVNIHELANRLKIIAIPGEELTITLQHIGKDPTQGVGYLEDGTMVVVEHAADALSQTLPVVITRVIQTSSGKILFGKKK